MAVPLFYCTPASGQSEQFYEAIVKSYQQGVVVDDYDDNGFEFHDALSLLMLLPQSQAGEYLLVLVLPDALPLDSPLRRVGMCLRFHLYLPADGSFQLYWGALERVEPCAPKDLVAE